jgi:hypothetical protein
MSSTDSPDNSTTTNLESNQVFFGRPSDANNFTKCGVSIFCDQTVSLFVYQSITGTLIDKVDIYQIPASVIPTPNTEFAPQKRMVEINYRYVWINVRNTSVDTTTVCRIQTQFYNAGFLSERHDRASVYGVDSVGTLHQILTDLSGSIVVSQKSGELSNVVVDSGNINVDNFPAVQAVSGSVSISNIPAVQAVSGSVSVSNIPSVQDVSGNVSVSNFPAVQAVSGSVSVSNIPSVQDVSGNVSVSNFPALQQIEGEVVLDHTKVGETGDQFEFIPTVANNTASVYADGAIGVNIVNFGWQYINNPSASLKKINWYIYQSPLPETSYKVSQLENIYCVLNNTSTLLPFFNFYTRPTGVNDGASWYKSRITFTTNTAGTAGMKFLYTGTDPTHIHPEITGVNRIQLVFNAGTSTKTPEQAADELIFTSTLQTDAGVSGAGVYNFIFQEYGIVWEKMKVFLPVEFGKLLIKGDVAVSNFPATQPVSGSVSVSNFPATQPVSGSVSVSNLADIETALNDVNSNLESIDTNTIYFTQPPTKYTLLTIPETFTIGQVVTNSTLPLKANALSNVLFRNVIYMGEIDASTFTDPKLIFEYSDDDINWFSDGVSASFNKRGTTWYFAFQRSSIGVAYVRLVAQSTTRITYAVANLSM